MSLLADNHFLQQFDFILKAFVGDFHDLEKEDDDGVVKLVVDDKNSSYAGQKLRSRWIHPAPGNKSI